MKSLRYQFIGIVLLAIAAIAVIWLRPLKLGLDLQGGTRLVLEAQDTKEIKADDSAVSGALTVIRNRIDSLGVAEPMIQRKGQRQIIVELPGIADPDRAIKMIGDTALLEFVEAEWAPASEMKPEDLAIYGEGARLVIYTMLQEGQKVERPLILKKTVLTGADLKSADPSVDQYGAPVVSIAFKSKGADIFAAVTAANVNKPIAILLDNKIISAPNVREPIPNGQAQISGNFTIQEVKDLVIQLRAGALPVPVALIENKIIGPTLGRDSIAKSRVAGLVALLLVAGFMFAFYRTAGLLADAALLVYGLLVIAALSLLHATLTLPGIAGFILSLGMAVDANVIIFERIKEEQKRSEGRLAVEKGFHNAFPAIFDSNITTLITTAILFVLGTGPIRGFAVTLSIGVVMSMFSALIITRVFLEMAFDKRLRQEHGKIF